MGAYWPKLLSPKWLGDPPLRRYATLNLQSHFTASKKVILLWTTPTDTAPLHATVVTHTQFARGFLLAGCSLSNLAKCEMQKGILAHGKLCTEGKDDEMHEGNACLFPLHG